MNGLHIEYLPIEQLMVYENNARKHEKADLQAIENSIVEFGMCDPIGIWSDKNIIVEGHGRLFVLQKLKHKTVPCIRLDHLNDKQRRAYALAHNKTAELSEWDFEKLETELAGLVEDFEMNDFGFDDLMNDNPVEVVEDEIPDIDEQSEPTVKRGQIWKLGNHYLICGDATSTDDVQRLMKAGECTTCCC